MNISVVASAVAMEPSLFPFPLKYPGVSPVNKEFASKPDHNTYGGRSRSHPTDAWPTRTPHYPGTLTAPRVGHHRSRTTGPDFASLPCGGPLIGVS